MTSASVVQAQTTFTVNTTDDIDDGTCDATHCSLREAINAANANAGLDTITFNIPGPGPHTIQPTSALPTITDPVIIDGYTQAGTSPNTNPPKLGLNTVLMIELDGSNAGAGSNGLLITAGNSTVRGLAINRFGGGVLGGPGGNGIRVVTNGGNVIEGSFIGTDVTGTVALGNSHMGVLILFSANNTVGGTTAEARNLISANNASGVHMEGIFGGAVGNLVQGNLIGTDVTGTSDLGNASTGVTISYDASDNTIGGTTAWARNVISGNDGSGIVLISGATENLVQGNFIGTDVTGTAALVNSGDGVHINGASCNIIGGTAAGTCNIISGNKGCGVFIVNAIGNLVQGNTITLNGADGVRVGDVYGNIGTANAILSNSIFSNGGLGIDLDEDGVTPNDPGDSDNGSNNLQNFPVLTSATSGSSITIEGTLNSTPNTEFHVEFFSNSACDPSGHGEGEAYLGYSDVTTDGSGDVTFAVTFPGTVPLGYFITATATDPAGNTSEFSQCVQVTGYVPPPSEIWVDDDYTTDGYNDGHTWGYDAFAKIQEGIDAVAGSIVHVAAGTYYENITLKNGVQVLGAGAEVTTIDGGSAGSVVTAIGVELGTVLDGFTITGGVADVGGGMYNYESSPAVTNCNFYNNSAYDGGGGMYNWHSSPTVTSCTFLSNSGGWGGGIQNEESSPTVTSCRFLSNSASNGGGGMYNHVCSPAAINCIFSSNSAPRGWAGGMHNSDSSPMVTNCTFSSNSDGGMLNWESSPIVTNCIFWDNEYEISNSITLTTVTYCDIQGGYPGDHNISEDPMFIDPAGNDYHLKIGSPCIDAGTNDAPGLPATDFEGDPRIWPVGEVVDMGADEYVPPPTVVEATVDFDPDTLNLKSKGKVVTVYIELAEGYDASDINVSTVLLNDTVSAESKPVTIGDYDGDGVPDLMVKFDRSAVQSILDAGNEVEVTISGELTDGTLFEDTDRIRVINKGKK